MLQLFLSSPKPALRFAAVRTLNEVAMKHPVVVQRANGTVLFDEEFEGQLVSAMDTLNATLRATQAALQ